MNVLRIDHTAVVVRDLDEAIDRYHRLFGVPPDLRRIVADQGVEVAMLPMGDTRIELIRPIDPDGGVARFLDRRGESLHHVGLLVEDIQQELDALAEEEVELIDRLPRRGVHGLVAFVHPRGTGGVLVELVEHRDDVLQT